MSLEPLPGSGWGKLVISCHDDVITLKEGEASIDLFLTTAMSEYLLDRVIDRLGIEQASRILAKRSNRAEG